MEDKVINCQDCGEEFAFTVGEQEFYKSKELKEPAKCLVCRSIEKAKQKDKFKVG